MRSSTATCATSRRASRSPRSGSRRTTSPIRTGATCGQFEKFGGSTDALGLAPAARGRAVLRAPSADGGVAVEVKRVAHRDLRLPLVAFIACERPCTCNIRATHATFHVVTSPIRLRHQPESRSRPPSGGRRLEPGASAGSGFSAPLGQRRCANSASELGEARLEPGASAGSVSCGRTFALILRQNSPWLGLDSSHHHSPPAGARVARSDRGPAGRSAPGVG